MRHERRSEQMPALDEAVTDMVTVVERHRAHRGNGSKRPKSRELKGTVTVMLWQEPDGTETVEVVGKPECGVLAMKGLLHDGLYALIHEPV